MARVLFALPYIISEWARATCEAAAQLRDHYNASTPEYEYWNQKAHYWAEQLRKQTHVRLKQDWRFPDARDQVSIRKFVIDRMNSLNAQQMEIEAEQKQMKALWRL